MIRTRHIKKKLVEKAIHSQFLDFLNSNFFFRGFQFISGAKHSTEHAMATLMNYLHSLLDSVDSLFLILPKRAWRSAKICYWPNTFLNLC